ncbi:argininosuccinate lyase [Engelhardtia mirabilis]|uniref:argininosuccinate lyase n=1 Tax=Engelhardtia mirabilis TaxID=2528011 RepID=UPI0011A14391
MGLWGGRFASGQDPRFLAFQESLSIDRRLIFEDLEVSRVWARALVPAGVLDENEAEKLVAGLDAIEREVRADPQVLLRSAAEDVHSFVEARLNAALGDLGRRLHTGRSRNDQVATGVRMHLRRVSAGLQARLGALQLALAELAEGTSDLALPGYTHMQRAQPITAGHHSLAYVEMFERDAQRLGDAAARMDRCPLGCGALAGTAFEIDREAVARDLGFGGGPCRNSIDAVSDRDHLCELVFAASLISVHLSRLAEDWIFFATNEAGFLELDDAVCTGSSLMPQKKNPDALELIRGKCGHVTGALQALLTMLKGTPLAYNRDLQEDKRALFLALDETAACLEVAELCVRGARYDAERCRSAATTGYLNATDLADLLVRAGVPFRTAHERAGVAVRRALELGVELEDLPAALRTQLLPELGEDLSEALSIDAVLARRSVVGGTAPVRVHAEAERWKTELGTRLPQDPSPTTTSDRA